MRTREIFRYLVAMIIALSTTVNAMAQERNLKIYFSKYVEGGPAVPQMLITDDNNTYDIPAGITISSEGLVWATSHRLFEGWHGSNTDRLLADYKDATNMESHLKLSFGNFPYEVNAIQMNAMNDLFSGSLSEIFQINELNTTCTPVSGNAISSSDDSWALNVLNKEISFQTVDLPGFENRAFDGLSSFEVGEKIYRVSVKLRFDFPFFEIVKGSRVKLGDKDRTFIKAGWNGVRGEGSNITDNDDTNWAFKVKFTLPDIRMRCYSCRVANNVILGELDNTIIVGESGKHALRGDIAAHAGAVVPTHDPSDIDAFHYEYFAKDPNQITITKNTGVISDAKVAGDIPVIVKLMRGTREVCSKTEYIHVMAPGEVLAKIAIGFENGKKGYDVTVGDQNAQIKGFFTENSKNITPTEDPNGYHFEYTESSNGQIIAIDKYTGKITAKKEGNVNVSAVLKKDETIISNTYTYTLHVFAQHEGLEWQRENIYAQARNDNANSWTVGYNDSPTNWQASDYLNTKTTILENNSQQSSGSSTDSWKQIAWFTTGEFNYWRPVCQKIKMDVHVPKYSKAKASYRFAANVTIGPKKGNNNNKYGFEVKDLGTVTSGYANTIIKNITWNTTSSSETTSSSSGQYTTTTIVRNGADRHTEYVGAGSNPNWETDNSEGDTHMSQTRYLAVMAYLHKNYSYPGDFSVGYKDIPTYTYYSTVTYYMNDGTGNTCGTSDSYTSNSKTGTDKLYKNPNSSTKPKPTRAGYEFLGWSTNPEATVAEYEYQGQFCPYDDVNGGGKGPVSLYAVWRANTYTVELRHTDGGSIDGYVYATSGQAMPSVDVEGNTVKAPNHTGYDFKGYYAEALGKGTLYYNEDMSSNHVWDRTDKNYVIAKWAAHKTTVNLNFQGGANGTTQITATYGQAMPTATAPSREGYVFDGYYSEANGQGTKYYEADMASANKWDIDERLLDPQVTEVTLYAKWIKVLFTITLDADGGTLDYKEINTWGTILEKNANSLVLQVEKNESKCTDIWCSNRINIKPGYKLLGWYTEPQTEEDAHHHPALHPGTLVYSVDPGNNFSYHFRAVSETGTNPKYWNSEKKWVGTDDLTLYAHYEMIFEVENDVITFLDSEPKNCVSGEDLTAALDYAKNHGAKLINTFDMTHPDTGADGKQGEDIMKAFEDAKAEAGSIVSPNALIYFTNTWPQNRKTNAITMNKNGGLCQDLVITDRYSIRIPVEFNAQKATYARDAGIVDAETNQAQNSTWGTLCLPYPIKNNTNGVKFYWLESTANNYMEFEEFGANAIIPANTPVIYIRTEGISSKINIVETYVDIPENATYTPVTIDYANPKAGTYPLASASKTLDNWEFTGNLDTKVFYGKDYNGNPSLPEGFIPDEEEQEMNDYIYYFKKNNFTRLSAKSYMILYPYRAYFRQVNGAKNGAKISSYSILVVGEDGSTTDITNAVFGDGEGDGKIYDLNGIRVMQPVKGRLYIVNGQKKVYR